MLVAVARTRIGIPEADLEGTRNRPEEAAVVAMVEECNFQEGCDFPTAGSRWVRGAKRPRAKP